MTFPAVSSGEFILQWWEDFQLVTPDQNGLSPGRMSLRAIGEGRASGSITRAFSQSPQRHLVCFGPLDGQAAKSTGVLVATGSEWLVPIA